MEKNKKTKIMFDTNAFDKAYADVSRILKRLNEIEIYITSIQVQELAKIPDSKRNIRLDNFLTVCDLRPILIPAIFNFENVDFAHFSFEVEPAYYVLLKEDRSNANDAIIAATAIHEGCVLVTDDSDLTKRIKKLNKGTVLSYKEFSEQVLRNNKVQ